MWKTKNKLMSSCLGMSLALMLGCGLTPFQDDEDDKGSISFAVQFPEKEGFQTQLIKPETVKLFAAVYGSNLPFNDPLISSPIVKPGSGANTTRKKLTKIPIGKQTILVAAYDSKNKILTAGKKETQVIGDSTTRVEIEIIENYTGQLTAQEVELLANIPIDDPVKEKEPDIKKEPVSQTQPNPSSSANPTTPAETKKEENPINTPPTTQPDKSEPTKTEEKTKETDKKDVPQPKGFSLVHPSGNLSVSSNSSVTFATSVIDTSITQVEFFAGNQKLGTVTKAPFDFSWQTSGFNDGEHEVKAVAKDINGKIVATSDSRILTIRRTTTSVTPPSVPPPPTPTPTPTPGTNINTDVTVNDGTTGAPAGPGAF